MADVTAGPGAAGQAGASWSPGGAAAPPMGYWTDTGHVHGPITEQEASQLAGRSMAVITDPAPLGFATLASATWMISIVFAGWYSFSHLVMAIPVALVVGGIAQFLAGMWAFRRGNVLLATVFGVFGSFYAAWALLPWPHVTAMLPMMSMMPGVTNPGVFTGWFMLAFWLIALYLFVAALGENLVLAAVLLTLAIACVFDGIGVMIGTVNNWAMYIGGYAGIVSALLALYLSAAIVINSMFGRTLLPTFTVGTQRTALAHR